MRGLYISKVIIKNFRNFRFVDVDLDHKQVIIGENNVGKTNFLRALQLILDPSLSDDERYLEETDFYDGLENPMEKGEEIEIRIFISNYKHLKNVLAQLSDATVILDGQEALKITYKYYPEENDDGVKEYKFVIFKGDDESKFFTYEDRKYLQLRVIKALRDVESEIKNTKLSPINKLLKQYDINKSDLNSIAEELKAKSADILNLDELVDLERNINSRFSTILATGQDLCISLKTIDIDPARILTSLKLLMAGRQSGDISLGLNNILYISLILLLLQDKTIPSLIKAAKFDELVKKPGGKILNQSYEKNDNGNYFLKDDLELKADQALYVFMDKNAPRTDSAVILAIEEPEAHLHPIFQRLIYKDVIRNNDLSVLLTTHSTHISSIAHLKSIVHLFKNQDDESIVRTAAKVPLTELETFDLERYLDVKRGEIYLGKGVILVEGITEEFLVPKYAEIIGKPLDEKGIVVCNINSTNFKPYMTFLEYIGLPYVVITDGDFYYTEVVDGKEKKTYHDFNDEDDPRDSGFLGHEIIANILAELNKIDLDKYTSDMSEQDKLFRTFNVFVGYYTFEIDMMEQTDEKGRKIIEDIFDALTTGGAKQKKNFKQYMADGDYWRCLRRIEDNIGKGRFAQRLSLYCNKEHVPAYVEAAINHIYGLV